MSLPELPESVEATISRTLDSHESRVRSAVEHTWHDGYRSGLEAAMGLPRELAALVGELEPETWRIVADACKFYADDRKRIVARRSFEQGPEFAAGAQEMIAALDRAHSGIRAVARVLERA